MAREYILKSSPRNAELRIDYAKELNEQQCAAVTAPPGPALVIAGAGSGKTRTLTYRVAFLIEQGIPPERILLLTFTNKAAREMMRRVGDLVGGDMSALWGGTFHAIGNRVLRREAARLGYRNDFTIIDREDVADLIKMCVAELVEVRDVHFPKPESLADLFSLAANTCRPLAELLDHPKLADQAEKIQAVFNRYMERKRTSSLMDFDDLLALWLKLLQENPEARDYYQRRFQFLLIDEYQDTNKIQGELIDLLVAKHRNVMVVGDDAQSIYSWRGAYFLNILDFPKRYPEAAVYRIETNYRSTPEILHLANQCIAHNQRQHPKKLVAARPSGSKPVLVSAGSSREQAMFVRQRVLELRDEGIPLSSIAILYRSHFHALELQLELTQAQIPFVITSGMRFFEQAHIKDITAYLKLVVNPWDELAFKRMARLLRGIGGKTADKLWVRYLEAIAASSPPAAPGGPESQPAEPKPSYPVAAALQKCLAHMPQKAQVDWAALMTTVSEMETSTRPAPMLRAALEGGYQEYAKATFPNYRTRLEEIEYFISFAESFNDTADFLSQLALLATFEADPERPAAQDDKDRLRLSTIHQAKGLEFDVVFMIMLAQGMFPTKQALDSNKPDIIEEERRLFYVGVTRARNELYLIHPESRIDPSTGAWQSLYASAFLRELDETLYEHFKLKRETSNWYY